MSLQQQAEDRAAAIKRGASGIDAKVNRKGKQAPIAAPVDRPARGYDAADLVSMDMPDPVYACRPWVAEGLTLFVGRPKLGKTTMMRQLACALNVGDRFLDGDCLHTPVMFLSLEEGERLFRTKLKRDGVRPEQLRGIRLEFEWPQGGDGVAALRLWLMARPVADRRVVIVIDSLTRFRTPPSDRGHAFTEDYNAVKLLADLAKEFPGLSVLVLHHTTKAIPDDPVASISGTYGLSAAADSYLILMKQGTKFRLHAGGRLWEGDCADFEVARDSGRWRLVGEWEDPAAPGMTPKQREVMELLRDGAKSNKVLLQHTGQTASALSHLMTAMERRGLVIRMANGWGIAT